MEIIRSQDIILVLTDSIIFLLILIHSSFTNFYRIQVIQIPKPVLLQRTRYITKSFANSPSRKFYGDNLGKNYPPNIPLRQNTKLKKLG